MPDILFDNKFLIGVNYWPRHRAVRMWKDWAPDEIETEFAEMKSLGLNCARIFTVWDDFQPLLELKGYMAGRGETVFRHDYEVTPEVNPEMIDPVMVERFDQLLQIARSNGIGLIVTLLVGWMSGGLLDVSWREGRNIFVDPAMLKWQSLYCRFFASRYRDEETILAWDLGNEQNCFMDCPGQEAAWNWMNTLVSVLKRYDSHHPVVSGMHGLGLGRHDGDNAWTIRDVADCCDFTTVHAYPAFIDGGDLDTATDIRTTLLASAQNSLYAGLGAKPCLCQEFGSLGDSIMSEGTATDYLRPTLYSLLANNSLGALWWCHSDFSCGDTVPYRWGMMENDGLGLYAVDGRAKPVAMEFGKFAAALGKLNGRRLAPAIKRAAIMSPFRADDWKPLFNSFVLCKQAGIEVEFIDSSASPEGYELLLLPSLSGFDSLESRQWKRLKEYVRSGGTLYLSHQGASLTGLEELFGVHPVMRKRPAGNRCMTAVGEADLAAGTEFNYCGRGDFELVCALGRARPVLTYFDGHPAMTIADYGLGRAVLMNEPIEMLLSRTPEAFSTDESWRIYRWLKRQAGIKEVLETDHPSVQCTIHPADGDTFHVVIINHSTRPVDITAECRRPIIDCKALSGREVSLQTGDNRLKMRLNACSGEIIRLQV